MTMIIGKAALAEALGMSAPTLDALLRRHPDLPVAFRGTRGIAWRFDLEAVQQFLLALKAAKADAATRRAAQAEQCSDEVGATRAAARTPRHRLALARAQRVERELAVKTGALAPTSEVRQALTAAFACLQRDLRSFLRALAREHHWPDAVLRRHEAELARMQRAYVAEMRDELASDDDRRRASAD
jgi:phage terminase Nu1 subunit (DNA packaging protein)